MRARALAATLVSAASILAAPLLAQPLAGQRDDFEGGTTQGWSVGDPAHPQPPTNVATGGPGGAGDNYLLLTSVGGNGPGSRLSAVNLAQWAGDYRAAGIGAIRMDVANFGSNDIFLRLLWADPLMGPPTNVAVSSGVLLPAGSGWQTITFDLGGASITTLLGSGDMALRTATELRLFHNPAPLFIGPPNSSPPIVASLGVDNITAVAVVPEPSTLLLLGSGLLLFPLLHRRRRTR
jgi:hypothetical protein